MSFERDLLIKPKSNKQKLYIIKSNKNPKVEYDIIFLVNRENMVYGFCEDSEFYKYNSDILKIFDKDELGITKKRYNEIMSNNETEYFTYFLHYYPFENYTVDCLDKKVRGIRYSNYEESQILRQFIIRYFSNNQKYTLKDYLYNTGRYNEIWKMASEIDILGSLFEYEKNGELDKYIKEV